MFSSIQKATTTTLLIYHSHHKKKKKEKTNGRETSRIEELFEKTKIKRKLCDKNKIFFMK